MESLEQKRLNKIISAKTFIFPFENNNNFGKNRIFSENLLRHKTIKSNQIQLPAWALNKWSPLIWKLHINERSMGNSPNILRMWSFRFHLCFYALFNLHQADFFFVSRKKKKTFTIWPNTANTKYKVKWMRERETFKIICELVKWFFFLLNESITRLFRLIFVGSFESNAT